MCLVTTTTSTTYSTTTTITSEMKFDVCPDCPKNDTLIVPKIVELPILKIRSGRYEVIQNVPKDGATCVFLERK